MKKTFALVALLTLIAPIASKTTNSIESYASDRVEVIGDETVIFDADNSNYTFTGLTFTEDYNYAYEMYELGNGYFAVNFQTRGVLAPEGSVSSSDYNFSAEANLYEGSTATGTSIAKDGYSFTTSLDSNNKNEIDQEIALATDLHTAYEANQTYTIELKYSTSDTYTSSDTFNDWATFTFTVPDVNTTIRYDHQTEIIVDEIIANHTTTKAGLIAAVVILAITTISALGYIGYLSYKKNKNNAK